jgi:lysophospholipase L1-like esterase
MKPTSRNAPEVPREARAKRKKRPLRFKLLLALAAGLLAILGVELAYRVKLWIQVGRVLNQPNSFLAYNKSFVVYDRKLGYRYVPDSHAAGIRVTDGTPVLAYERYFDEKGNPSAGEQDDKSGFQILVFGDSFTALADQQVLWPDLLERRLEEQSSQAVSVENFSRDAYGILQMFDLAAETVKATPADAIIIAFITDDLNRDRFWLTVRTIEGRERVFASASPNADTLPIRPADFVEWELIQPDITRAWCRSAVVPHAEQDRIERELAIQFEERLKNPEARVNYLAIDRCFLCRRFAYGNPFFGLSQHNPIPRLELDDFQEDERFATAAKSLNESAAGLYLVHLPQYEELNAGRYLLTPQQRSLLESLEKLVGRKATSLLPHLELTRPAEEYFRLPFDGHPSKAGMELYANAVAKALGEKLRSGLGN